MNRRLTILMCADLVGYSALMGQDEALAVQSVRDLKKKHLEPVAANYGGEVLKRMGDGWILSFPGVEAALNCAEEVQTGLADHEVIKLRIGCHIGEIVEDEDDFYGNGVNIAQRIETEAPPGGLMFSEDLFRQLSETRQDELSDAGVFKLKNIATPMRLYQWRPANLTTAPDAGALPSIGFEAFVFAPNDADTEALAMDLHEGILKDSLKRTGFTTIDVGDDPVTPTVFLVRGRLRVARDRARFTLTLLLREDMSTLWSGTYEGDASDPFGFCDEIVARAESDIRIQTIQHDGDRQAHLSDDKLSVSELRARAANLFFKQKLGDWEKAYAALERAVALSPEDGMALAMRAQNRINWWAIRHEEVSDALVDELGRDLDRAAEELPGSDFVYWARGAFKLQFLDDLDAARFDQRRCREVNPNFIGVTELESHLALREGRFADALEAFSAYKVIGSEDPFKLTRLCLTARMHLCAGNHEAALKDATEASYLAPQERGVQLLKALVCREAEDQAGLAAARKAANALDKGISIHTPKSPLPDDFQWINDALHPEAEPV
ncbi:adenylate/guanylate cyclase domain-containing protein [uncultured Shimia sp.]|uniref:adenylate/guanylate cyclase domain-containing protein n=1 Tax=uncultured Shimia sp. TaxID=573152 RepID=UPI00262788F8|nr:adenylate/guanylate cyclase domain-containing protein [uncultured Shimia sp.]